MCRSSNLEAMHDDIALKLTIFMLKIALVSQMEFGFGLK